MREEYKMREKVSVLVFPVLMIMDAVGGYSKSIEEKGFKALL